MKENPITPAEQATESKLVLFWKKFVVGLRDFPRYVRSFTTPNRHARRKDIAQHGSHPRNAKARTTWLGFWEGRKSGHGVRVPDCPFALRKAGAAA